MGESGLDVSGLGVSGKAARGFTLIELAIAVAILGMLTSGVLAALNTYRNVTAYETTLVNMARIQGALTFHAIRTTNLAVGGHLPNPLDNNGDSVTAGTCRVGTVPHAPLGLTAQEVRDGWGNPFMLVLDANFAAEDPPPHTTRLTTATPLASTTTNLEGRIQFGPTVAGSPVDPLFMGCNADIAGVHAGTLLCPAYVLISGGGEGTVQPADITAAHATGCDLSTVLAGPTYRRAIYRTMTAAQIIRDAQ